MVDRFMGKKGELRNWLQSLHPVGRLGTSEETPPAVLYLAFERSEVYHRRDTVGRARKAFIEQHARMRVCEH
jgi:hypothetical protein